MDNRELILRLLEVAGGVVCVGIFYCLIRLAVTNGIKQAWKEKPRDDGPQG